MIGDWILGTMVISDLSLGRMVISNWSFGRMVIIDWLQAPHGQALQTLMVSGANLLFQLVYQHLRSELESCIEFRTITNMIFKKGARFAAGLFFFFN